MQKHPMTPVGAEKLKNELQHLKSVERPRIIEAIATARAHGDLKENAEYHAAREEQSFMEGRLLELEAKLSNAQVIDVTKIPNQGRVVFGSRVHLSHVETGAELIYQIVGVDEADVKLNKLSYSSPIGRAVTGKQIDDLVVVQTPNGAVEYEITAVDYI